LLFPFFVASFVGSFVDLFDSCRDLSRPVDACLPRRSREARRRVETYRSLFLFLSVDDSGDPATAEVDDWEPI